MRVPLALYGAVLCLCAAPILSAQDAVKTDPKHYSVVSENDQVRILKVHYGPHEKSVMHSHPNLVAVFLTDSKVQMTLADGKKVDQSVKAGESQYVAAGTHLPENVTDQPMEVILVELKGAAK
ncbi:MAG: cytoplasmic protein [Acidobacteria bacterium]|jgi:quercetin dioxygenase-like cupin family protein|nr:MAG: cytoplasmic protein [Acidobacteriota bacterium]